MTQNPLTLERYSERRAKRARESGVEHMHWLDSCFDEGGAEDSFAREWALESAQVALAEVGDGPDFDARKAREWAE